MRKKVLLIAISFMLLVPLALGLSACGKQNVNILFSGENISGYVQNGSLQNLDQGFKIKKGEDAIVVISSAENFTVKDAVIKVDGKIVEDSEYVASEIYQKFDARKFILKNVEKNVLIDVSNVKALEAILNFEANASSLDENMKNLIKNGLVQIDGKENISFETLFSNNIASFKFQHSDVSNSKLAFKLNYTKGIFQNISPNGNHEFPIEIKIGNEVLGIDILKTQENSLATYVIDFAEYLNTPKNPGNEIKVSLNFNSLTYSSSKFKIQENLSKTYINFDSAYSDASTTYNAGGSFKLSTPHAGLDYSQMKVFYKQNGVLIALEKDASNLYNIPANTLPTYNQITGMYEIEIYIRGIVTQNAVDMIYLSVEDVTESGIFNETFNKQLLASYDGAFCVDDKNNLLFIKDKNSFFNYLLTLKDHTKKVNSTTIIINDVSVVLNSSNTSDTAISGVDGATYLFKEDTNSFSFSFKKDKNYDIKLASFSLTDIVNFSN